MFKSSSLMALTIFSIAAHAGSPVIYGEDNRQEVFEASSFNQKLAMSAATMISKDKIFRSEDKPGLAQIEQTTLRSWLEDQFEEEKFSSLSSSAIDAVEQKISFCEGEKFIEQPNAGICSGFLVGPDLLVTAGHCVAVAEFCGKYSWVFDFKFDAETESAGVDVKEENIYNCKKVISTNLSTGLGLDFGLIQLDRKVTSRHAVSVRTEGTIADQAALVVIGSPSGLPLKVSSGANVRTNTHPFYFSANLDTFQGNSGSAVFNAQTGVVEGILVRGEDDFENNMALMCIEAKKCEDNSCRGEDVSRMTSIPEFAAKDPLALAAEKGDVRKLEKLTKIKFWIDIYGADGKTALMIAAENRKAKFVSKLIHKGSDVKIQDAKGNTALHLLASRLENKSIKILDSLVGAGAILEARNDSGETAILVAAKSLNFEGVKILIAQGSERNAVDKNNENALFAFSRKGDLESVKELIALGVDATVKNSDGQSVEDVKMSSPVDLQAQQEVSRSRDLPELPSSSLSKNMLKGFLDFFARLGGSLLRGTESFR